MKKLQHLIIALLAAGSLSAQTSIPNGGFEKWNVTSWSRSVTYQSTSNIDNITKNRGPANVVQSSVHIMASLQYSFLPLQFGQIPLLDIYLNGNTQNSGGIGGGIPYSQKPTGIRFYYKYTRTSNKDTVLCWLYLKTQVILLVGNK